MEALVSNLGEGGSLLVEYAGCGEWLDCVGGARPWYMVAVSLSNQCLEWSFKFVFRPSFWGFHLEIKQPQLLAMCRVIVVV